MNSSIQLRSSTQRRARSDDEIRTSDDPIYAPVWTLAFIFIVIDTHYPEDQVWLFHKAIDSGDNTVNWCTGIPSGRFGLTLAPTNVVFRVEYVIVFLEEIPRDCLRDSIERHCMAQNGRRC